MMVAAYKVSFRRVKPVPAVTLPCASRIARLLALAHQVDAEIRTDRIRDLADAARLAQVTRARMTQISNVLLLAPDLQEAILDGRADGIGERALRAVVREPDWTIQRELWQQLTEEKP